MVVFRRLWLILLVMIVPFQLYGIGADPAPVRIVQADGSAITLVQRGDEWFNWVTTTDGYRVIRNSAGIYEYVSLLKSGEPIPSGVKASNPGNRTFAEVEFVRRLTTHMGVNEKTIAEARQNAWSASSLKGVSSHKAFPASGTRKLLMILANFNDTQSTYLQGDFSSLMNQLNYNGTGSFRDYYLENSLGLLEVVTVVTEWVNLPQSRVYYAAQNKRGEFAYEAIKAASLQMDLSQFDNDGDGIVDAIAIIHQGRGRESSANPDDMWSFAWSLSAAGYSTAQRTFNGVLVNGFTVQPELNGAGTGIIQIGVICHEFGHVLGVPDYYDTDYELNGSFDGTGNWDLMGNGGYNGLISGSLPAHHNPLTKYELGWAQLQTISTPGNITLPPIIQSGSVLRVNSGSKSTSNEYFLLENRVRMGFDGALPGEGLIIYHVDGDWIASQRNQNTINTSAHQGMYPLAAMGAINSDGCPFPGVGGVTAFTDETTPSSLAWDGSPANQSITGIARINNDIVFSFMALQDGAPLKFEAVSTSESVISLSWEPSVNNHPVLLAVSADEDFGIPENGVVYAAGQTINGGGTVLYYGSSPHYYHHSNLPELTHYHYRLWSNKGEYYSIPLKADAVTRQGKVSSFPWEDDFEDGLIRWTQENVSGAEVFWLLGMGGNSGHPASAYSGTNNALFFSANQGVTKLITPVFAADAVTSYRLKFYHAQERWYTDQDSLKVWLRAGALSPWTLLGNYRTDEPLWRKRVLDMNPGADFQLAFEGTANYGYGVAIDKVEVFPYASQAPVVPPSDFKIIENNGTSAVISWKKGDGDACLVVCRKGNPVLGIPDDLISYSSGTVYGTGAQLEAGDFVIYSGDQEQVEISGLEQDVDYYFAIFGYNQAVRHYQVNPLKGHLVNTRIAVTVKNALGDPVSGAAVNVGIYSAITGSDGVAYLNVIPEVTDFLACQVLKSGYEDRWFRIRLNQPEALEVTLIPFEPVAPVVESSVNYKDVTLNWNPVVNENFSGYDAFTLSIPNWTFVDGDGAPTYTLSGVSFPNQGYTGSFIVYDGFAAGTLNNSREWLPYTDRQFLACVAANGVINNDWLISPEIKVSESQWLSFMARSAAVQYGTERLRVLVSDDGSGGLETFVPISEGDYVEVPGEWSLYRFKLDAFLGKKIRFAIQCVSDNALMLMIDAIRLADDEPVATLMEETGWIEKPFNAPRKLSVKSGIVAAEVSQNHGAISYEITRNGLVLTRLQGMAANTYIDAGVGCGTYNYRVRAVHVFPAESASSVAITVGTCYRVVFVVTDTGRPVEGASVTFNGVVVLTGVDGTAAFEGIDLGNAIPVKVEKEGFRTLQQTINVVGNQQVNLTIVSINGVDDEQWHIPQVVPNPSSGKFRIVFPQVVGEVRYSLSGLSGNRIEEGLFSEVSYDLDLKQLPSGIYLLQLNYINRTAVIKLFKK
jgi:M6 family metalloprotease-like protein